MHLVASEGFEPLLRIVEDFVDIFSTACVTLAHSHMLPRYAVDLRCCQA